MAKKKRERRERHYDVVNLCACIALFITAFLYLAGWVFRLFSFTGVGKIVSVLNLIASVALLIAIALPAYRHVRTTHNRRAWTACYWVALIVYIAVVFLGWSFDIFNIHLW